ncbi:unnamed protein product [Phytophthora fragariaefolia]|uniref:Unnamed protein product n=1 Tax=Phytophthora fragariaefolia TaxID=1490495 RepID=A0A9W6XXS1_9STRA|nr:unnamed protein product [Phytophthora fragariaefolia]
MRPKKIEQKFVSVLIAALISRDRWYPVSKDLSREQGTKASDLTPLVGSRSLFPATITSVLTQCLLSTMPASQRAKVLKSLSDMFIYSVLLEDFTEMDACDVDIDDGHDEILEETPDVYVGVKLNRYLGSRANVDRSASSVSSVHTS